MVVQTFEWLAGERARVRLKGERGKFFRAGGELRLPIYLNGDVRNRLTERAAQEGIPLGEMVNALLRHEIQRLESRR